MKRIDSTVTQRGQVTLPAEVRRLLGVGPRDKVTFIIDDGEVRVTRPKYQSVEDVYGSVEPLANGPLEWKEMLRIAEAERAERYGEKQQRGDG